MSDGTQPPGPKSGGADDEAALQARLKRLGERIDASQSTRSVETGAPGLPKSDDPSALARALRLSTELVAAVVVGFGIGFFLDRWLGTTPWGLIVFLLLGFAAGILNVMRAAGLATPGPGRQGQDGR
jgi:ATP synthase protein I